MFVYGAVIAVVVVMLVVSYRALAGGAVLNEGDYRTVLDTLSGFTRIRSRELQSALAASVPAGDDPDVLTGAATVIRKKLSSYQQQLGSFEVGIGEDLDAAHELLSTAIEDLGWACRMIEPGTYRDNAGIRAAVDALREHGENCLARARDVSVGGAASPGRNRRCTP